MAISRRRFMVLSIAALALLFGATAGALLGEHTLEPDPEETVVRATRVVDTLIEWLPEETDPSDIVYDGIDGMLDVLDPHSNFLDPRNFSRMRARQEGSFFGVGIIISQRNGQITIISPIAGTPGASKGLRAGDVIAAVEGESTEELTLDEVVDHVRGPEGSVVHLTIRRPGLSEPFEVEITRERIPTTSVRFAFMMSPEVGYVRLSEFSNTSVREVRGAIDDLVANGMKQLVFDLRNNPGGPLDAAVGVADTFLREGEMIVTTHGRTKDSISSFSAPGRGTRFEGSVIILVNGGSASASEIVAGAVQDHDRGLVLGDVTWGKGLVQTVYTVRDTGLALTTARYFTPSGRCIQRAYESYIDYITHRNGVTTANDPKAQVHVTAAGRTVLGGGGIAPDVVVEQREIAEGVVRLYGRSAFFRFVIDLVQGIPESKRSQFGSTFTATDEVLEEFWAFVHEAEILDDEPLDELRGDSAGVEDVRRALRVEALNSLVGLEEGYRVALEGDEQVVAALQHLSDAEDFWIAWSSNGSQDNAPALTPDERLQRAAESEPGM